jgi:hypothetical protein
MQVYGMQCSHPGWPQKHFRRSHAHRHPEKDETHRQEEAGQFFLLTHLIDYTSLTVKLLISNQEIQEAVSEGRSRSRGTREV